MNFFRHLLHLFVIMLLSVFGANMAFALPVAVSDITYFQTENMLLTQSQDVGFAARAPPLAAPNVTITGDVTVMQGSAFALHGQETTAALFGFVAGHNAPNSADDVFRGTTEGFEGGPNTVSTGSTPTSSDPLVSTCYSVNACNTNGGTGVVHVVDPNIADEVIDDYYGSLPHDFEVILDGVTPSQVAESASQTIPTSQAVDAFSQMGITVPSTTGPGQLDSALQELMQNGTTPLSPAQIQEFLDLTGGAN